MSSEKAFDYIETSQIGVTHHLFANNSFLLITQRQKVNNVYTVRNQAGNGPGGGGAELGSNRIYSIKHSFGAASDETEAAIRYLMNFINKNDEIVITFEGNRQGFAGPDRGPA